MFKLIIAVTFFLFAAIFSETKRNINGVMPSIYWLERTSLLHYLEQYDQLSDSLVYCIFGNDSGVVKASAYVMQGDTSVVFSNEKYHEKLIVDYKDTIPLLTVNELGSVDLSGMRTIKPGFSINKKSGFVRINSDCGDNKCSRVFISKIDSCSHLLILNLQPSSMD